MQDIIIKKNLPKKEAVLPEPDIPQEIVVSKVRPGGPKKSYGLLFISILALFILAVAIGGLFSEVVIKIVPKTFSDSLDTVINFTQVRTGKGIFLGTATQIFSEEKIIQSLGVAVESKSASGTVRIFNRGSQSVTLAEGTMVLSPENIKYHITETVTVPKQAGDESGTAEVIIEAKEPGKGGNSKVTDFSFAEENEAFEDLTLRGITDITGGSAPGDALADSGLLESTSQELSAILMKKQDAFRNRLAEELPDTMVALPIVLTPSRPMITTENHTKGLLVRAETQITLLAVDKVELANALKGAIPHVPAIAVTLDNLDGITMTSSVPIDPTNIPTNIPVRATGNLVVEGAFDESLFRASIGGISVKALKTKLSTIPELESFKVTMRPPWRRKVPLDPRDITILMKKVVN